MSKTDSRKKAVFEAVAVALIVGIVAFVIIILTYKKEMRIVGDYNNDDISGLVCESSDNEGAFFRSNTVNSVKHELKVTYNNGVIGKVSYEYNGKYDSKGEAEHDDAVLHARYNIYMGEHGAKSEMLTPVFQIVGDDGLRIRLYLENYKSMDSILGELFYIDGANIDVVSKNSLEETKEYFENNGFSCIISN